MSLLVRRELVERAKDFNIILDDVSITELSFGKEYTAAVEAKQVAQQEAQRAAFVVERAKQERQQKIVQAEGEAEAAKMISFYCLSTFLLFPKQRDSTWSVKGKCYVISTWWPVAGPWQRSNIDLGLTRSEYWWHYKNRFHFSIPISISSQCLEGRQ